MYWNDCSKEEKAEFKKLEQDMKFNKWLFFTKKFINRKQYAQRKRRLLERSYLLERKYENGNNDDIQFTNE